MKIYELVANITPDLSEEELAILITKIKDLIISEGGEITKTQDPIKKTLGYAIRHKKEVYLMSLNLNFSPDKVVGLNDKLRKEASILRFIIAEAKKPRPEKEPREFRGKRGLKSESNDIQELDSKELELKPETQKVEIKEIDQKIEEILNE